MASTAHKNDKDIEEFEDPPEILEEKIEKLYNMFNQSKFPIIFTGAGISTSIGINDFRGPNGVWTCKAQGRTPEAGISTLKAVPSATHMIIAKLYSEGMIQALISQNTDGLHRKTLDNVDKFAELHGNSNLETCEKCKHSYSRDFKTRDYKNTVHEHFTGRYCAKDYCFGKLYDTIINFGENLPQQALDFGNEMAKKSDFCLALGSSLTVKPANLIPTTVGLKKSGNLVIVNLQRTPLDSLGLKINAKTDEVMIRLMEKLSMDYDKFILKRLVNIKISSGYSQTGGDIKVIKVFGIDKDGINATFLKEVNDLNENKSNLKPGFLKNQTDSETKDIFTFKIEEEKFKFINFDLKFFGHYREKPLNLVQEINQDGHYKFELNWDPLEEEWSYQLLN